MAPETGDKTFPTRTERQVKRRQPLFPYDMWNVYDCILKEGPVTTNNGMESWNRMNPNM